ncbi:MAG: hypothetical protein RL442_2182, partial [Pseudomonadota bacterium]
MTTLALYCKSYSTDLRRLVRLAESVRKFNVEGLPFFAAHERKGSPSTSSGRPVWCWV